MNVNIRKHILTIISIAALWISGISFAQADSDLFPPQQNAPAITSYVSGGTFKHTYYISPKGNDTSGDGSITNPWLSFLGATSGGSGTPVGPGDLVYMRGGVYPTHKQAAWKRAYYNLQRSGTATDYIVFTKYPGETPQFTGGEGTPSFSINHSSYIVLDGLTFISGGNFGLEVANHITVQNLTFAACADGWGDQNLGTCIGIGDSIDSVVIRNNYFGPDSQNHAIKSYTSNSVASNVKVLYNTFNGITTGFGVINHKSPMKNWEYAYNRFQDCNIAINYGLVYNYAIDSGANIHHNVFDNVKAIIVRGSASTKDLTNFQVHDNVVLNNVSGNTVVLRLQCATSCTFKGTQVMGEFYNNVLFGISDAIDPTTTKDFVNYPSFWNYNAYKSTGGLNSAENVNNLGSASWQGNALITSDAIKVTGNSGNRLYYIADTAQFRGKGRNGDNIGGFTWGNEPVRPMPPSLQ